MIYKHNVSGIWKNAISAQIVEVSSSGIELVPRLDRDAWSMVQWQARKAANEYPPPLVICPNPNFNPNPYPCPRPQL